MSAVEQKSETQITTVSNLSDFKALLKQLKNSFHSYDVLKDKVSELKTGQQYQVGDTVIDKAALKQMKTDIGNAISDLYRYYGAGGKAKKSKASSENKESKPRKNGFDNPVYVSKYIVDFYTKNPQILGTDSTGKPIASQLLSLVQGGLTTSTILTNLWSIILHTQKSQIVSTVQEIDPRTKKPRDVSFYHADNNMRAYFGPSGSNTFAFLAAKPSKVGKDEQPLPPFNPDRFAYTAWQSIFAHNKLASDKTGVFQLSAEHANMLNLLKEYKNLSTKDPVKLTPEETLILSCVEKGSMPPNPTQEQSVRIRNYIGAKQILDRLAQEKDIVSATLKSLKALNPAPPKKSKAKAVAASSNSGSSVASVGPTGNGFSAPSFGSSFAVPKL
jgi:hypothetical protein